jgi:hypothetical protein
MKTIYQYLMLMMIFTICSCSASRKELRAENKRKRDAAKLEQLEKDKAHFEQKNKRDLGE